MPLNITKRTIKNTIINLLIIGFLFGPLLYLTNIIVSNYNNVKLILYYWLWYLFAYIFIALAYALIYNWLVSALQIANKFYLKLSLGIVLSLLLTMLIYWYDIFYGKIPLIVYMMSINLALLSTVYVFLEHRNGTTIIENGNRLETG